MGTPVHLDFSQDKVPGSERENESTFADFPWEELFTECDGDLAEAKACVEERDYKALAEAIECILRAILSGRDNHQRGVFESIGRRAVAAAFVFNPMLLDKPKATELAQELRCTKQNFAERARDVQAFLLKHPARRTKVSRLPMGGASAPNTDENRDTATDCSQSAGACEAPELERHDDPAPASFGGAAA